MGFFMHRGIPLLVGSVALIGLCMGEQAYGQTCVASGSDLNCTNSDNIANHFLAFNNNNPGTTTATNSGSVGQIFQVFTNGAGSATGTNSGSVGQIFQVATNGAGSATGTNSGSVGRDFLVATNGAGSTTGTNSGSVGRGFQVFTAGAGSATGTNSGSVGQAFLVATAGAGSTTGTNSGSVGQVFQVVTQGAGATTATNSGSVGQFFQVITQGAGAATAVNSGRVLGGVSVLGGGGNTNLALVNSGFITTSGGPAVQFVAGVDTLTLLPGSFIVGAISLVGTNDRVIVNAGNQNLTFNTLAGATVTGNVPFAVVGNRIVSLDPTAFAMQGRALNDFSREVSSAIPQLTGVGPSGGAPLAFAAPDASARIEDVFATIPGLSAYSGEAMAFKNPTVIYGDGSAVWARGFGGNRLQSADGTVLPGKSQFYGGMIGGDMRVRPDLRIGAFLGMGNSRYWIDQPLVGAGANFGNGNSDIAFGGVYGQYDAGATFLRAALQVGGSRNTTTRNINNNLLANGLETANAGFNGWYVSPEATIGHRLALGTLADAAYTLTPSLRLRYLYGSFDGYTETGTTSAPLTMGGRTIGTMEERGELKLTRSVTFNPQNQLSLSGYGGVQGTQRAGDSTLNAAFLGQAIPFAAPGQASVWGGYGGAGLEWRTRNVTLFSAAEYLWLSDKSTVVSGRSGLRVAF